MKLFKSGLVLMAGFLGAAAAAGHADHDVTKTHPKNDVRIGLLRRFLEKKHSPAASYAETFILEADTHGLDWRLLPSLAFVESGGGKNCHKNNLFGWDNGASKFSSATAAIHEVATALAEARPYRGKSTQGKLAAYNESPDYKNLVTTVMRRISPVVLPESL
ncbi:MAG TPA: hypothetical protein VHC90_07020 [Bryobacteraceae bacterium]|nr:hypothetical protein [Bryobacteraceae bacterium]